MEFSDSSVRPPIPSTTSLVLTSYPDINKIKEQDPEMYQALLASIQSHSTEEEERHKQEELKYQQQIELQRQEHQKREHIAQLKTQAFLESTKEQNSNRPSREELRKIRINYYEKMIHQY